MADAAQKLNQMGSKSDMISVKFDEVCRNQIWREHLVKEAKLEGELIPFQFNPSKVNSVSEKPTLMDPRKLGQVDTSSTSSDIRTCVVPHTFSIKRNSISSLSLSLRKIDSSQCAHASGKIPQTHDRKSDHWMDA